MLIILEGLPGCGKTTQVEILKNYYEGLGKQVSTFHFPYEHGYGYEGIQEYLNYGSSKEPLVIAKMFLENMVNADVITSVANMDSVVIFDRWIYSPLAIQGAQTKTEEEFLKFKADINNYIIDKTLWISWIGAIPGNYYVFYLDVSLDEANRVETIRKQSGDYIYRNPRKLDNLWFVKNEYLLMCHEGTIGKKSLTRIDCMKDGRWISKEDVTAKILGQLKWALNE